MSNHRWDVVLVNVLVSFGLSFLPIVLTVGWKAAAVAGGIAVCTNLAGLYQLRPNSPLRMRDKNLNHISHR